MFGSLASFDLENKKKIADASMNWAHKQFNSSKIAEYILELIETGTYSAPWKIIL